MAARIAPSFQKAPTITQTDDGLSVQIDSVVKSNPKPTCVWYLNDQVVVKSPRIIPSIEKVGDNYRCSLLIKDVSLDDSGSYRLLIENALGELKATVNLQLQADDAAADDEDTKGKKPKFTQKPEIRKENDSVVFECRLTADPAPTCEWFKETQKLNNGGRYIIKTQSLPDDSYLVSCTVKDIQAEDGGAYRVVAKNERGEATATLSLNIADNKGRPNILSDIKIRPFLDKLDDTIMIECICEADPAPEFVWYFKDKPLSQSSKYVQSVFRDGDKYVAILLIQSMSKADSGQYRLVAKNNKGEHSANISLDVTGSKSLPSGSAPSLIGLPRFTMNGNDVVLSMDFTGKPLPSFNWTRADNEIIDPRFITSVEKIGEGRYSAKLVIKNATTKDSGKFACTALNEIGRVKVIMDLKMKNGKPESTSAANIAPTFTAQPKTQFDAQNKILKIIYPFKARPAPTAKWLKNRLAVKNVKGKIETSIVSTGTDTYNAILLINNFGDSDEAYYKLEINNEAGTAVANVLVSSDNAESVVLKHKVEFGRPIVDYDEKTKKLVIRITCISTGVPSVVWSKDNRQISSNRHYNISMKDGEPRTLQLIINDFTATDFGKYSISATSGDVTESKIIDVNKESLGLKDDRDEEEKEEEEEANSPEPEEKKDDKAKKKKQEVKSPEPEDKKDERRPSLLTKGKLDVKSPEPEGKKDDKKPSVLKKSKLDVKSPEPEGKKDDKKPSVLKKGKLDVKSPEPEDKKDERRPSLLTKGRFDVKSPEPEGKKDDKKPSVLKKGKLDVKSPEPEDKKDERRPSLLTKGRFDVKSPQPEDKKDDRRPSLLKKGKLDVKPSEPEDTKGDRRPSLLKKGKLDVKSPEPEGKKDDKKPSPAGKGKLDVKSPEPEDKKGERRPSTLKKDKLDFKSPEPEDKKDDRKPSLITKIKTEGKSPQDSRKASPLKTKDEESGKPKITGPLKNVTATDGDKVVLESPYKSSIPLSQVTWYYNDKEISPSDDIVMEDDGKSVRLILKDAYVDDSGAYRIVIGNNAGNDEKSGKVTVQPKRGRAPRIKPKSKVLTKKPVAAAAKPKEAAVPVVKAAVESPRQGTPENPESSPSRTTGKDSPNQLKRPSYLDKRDGKDSAASSRKSSTDSGRKGPVAAQLGDKPLKVPGASLSPSDTNPSSRRSSFAKDALKVEGAEGRRRSSRLSTESPRGSISSPRGSRDESGGIVLPQLKRVSKTPLKATVKPALNKESGAASATPLGAGDGAKWPTLRKTTVAKKVPDHWVVHMADKIANEEEGTTTLEATFCRAGGTLRWYKNRVEIFHGQKYNFISEGPVQKLQINKIIPDDSGRYICSVNDIETKAWLEVKSGKPDYEFYLQLPAKHEVFRTKRCMLECHVNQQECPVKWTKDGKNINLKDSRYSVIRDLTRCLLRIEKTKREDEGVYACEIMDEPDKKTSCYLYITEPQWRFSKKLPSNIEVNEDKDAVLEVEVEDPDAECEWFQKGELIPDDGSDPRYVMESHGRIRRLIIKGCKPGVDSGFVECKTGVMVSQTNLVVKPNLKITSALKDVQIVEGNDLDLKVDLSMPRKNVAWLFNGKRILPDANHIILNDGLHYLLKIKETTLQTSGTYKLTIDGIETECSVEVKEADKKPEIDMSSIPHSINVIEGNKLRIVVPYKANPQPEIVWLRDGKPISANEVEISSNERETILEIPITKRSDKGTYSVVLRNTVGEASAKVEVKVAGKPDAPEGPMRISEITKSGALLGWRVPPSDGDSPITGYIVERLDTSTSEDAWEKIADLPADSLKYKVTGLTEGKSYNFRVRAINSAGISPALEASKPVLAKNPYDVSDAPGPLQAVDIDADRVTLAWTAPAKDGGAKIEQYIIEKRPAGQDWTKAAVTNGNELKVVVTDLPVETKFEFRVMALNKAGLSNPSNLKKPVLTTPKTVKPLIRKGALKDITIKKGVTLKLLIPFIGKPVPEVVWYCNGKPLNPAEDPRITITNTNTSSELSIKDSLRKDMGKYKVTITNSTGSDSSECNVVVLGPPDRPHGPLKVNDITKNSVKLTWDLPEDDGGRPIRNFLVEKMDVDTGEWIPAGKVDGNTFVVPKLKQNHQYKFRVMAQNDEGMSEPLTSEEPVLVKPPFDEPGAPGTPTVSEKDRTHIGLKWEPPRNDGGAPVYGYVLERRAHDSDRWVKLHHDDFITTTEFDDKRVKPNETYEYRVSALNEAGEGPKSASTGMLQAKPDKEAATIDKSNLPSVAGRTEIRVYVGDPIGISLPILGTPTPEVKWTKDGEDLKPDDRFTLKQEDEKISLNFPVAKRSDSGAYEVTVTNEVGSDSLPINIVVLGPPGPIKGPITHENISKNEVVLKWEAPEDDGGLPLFGYVIEKSLAGTDVWEPSGESATDRFTARNLEPNQKYKFRVRAKNQRGRGEPLTTTADILVKPPYDPPSAPSQPEITGFDKDFVALKWSKPFNDGGNPIYGYVVEMKDTQSGTEWIPCSSGVVRDTEFTVSSVKPNRAYEFRVKAVNDAGPGEASKPSKAQKTISPITPPSVPGSLSLDGIDTNEAKLSWKAPEEDGGAKVSSYRIESSNAENPGEWTLAAEVSGRDRKAVIPKMKKGAALSFRIIAVNEAGPSEPSIPTDFETVEDPPEAPRFLDLSQLKDITCQAGNSFINFVSFKGFPAPSVDLSMVEQPSRVLDISRFDAKIDQDQITIANKSAERADSGLYRLNLKNSLGSASATFKITVFDVPSSPTGPIETTVIDREKTVISWNSPKDDGGKPIEGYVVEKRIPGTEKWIRCGSSRGNVPECVVSGLKEGETYEFRVTSQNELGQSEPLVTDEPVKIKLPYKVPNEPENVICTGHTPESISIAWDEPSSDGGSPITHYVVEKMDETAGGGWVKVGRASSNNPTMTVPRLEEGHRYHFRVSAVNDAGESDWKQTDNSIEAREPDQAPKLLEPTHGIKKIRLMKGEPLHIPIRFQSSPIPEVIMKKDGIRVDAEVASLLKVNKTQVDFDVSSAEPTDSGSYEFVLSNPLGKVSSFYDVEVVDVPGAPNGPLTASNVSPTGLTLSWEPPTKTGGSDVQRYVIEMMDSKIGQWKPISKYCRENRFEVFDLKQNGEYKFRVAAVNEAGASEYLEMEKPVIAKASVNKPGHPKDVQLDKNTFEEVSLRWNPPLNDGGSKIIGYQVESRRTDEPDEWSVLSVGPIRTNEFSVDSLLPGRSYEFRVSAINSAGVGEPAQLDQTVKTKGCNRPPQAPSNPEAYSVGNDFVELAWEPPTETGGAAIMHYVIEKRIEGEPDWVEDSLTTIEPYATVHGLPPHSLVEFRVRAVNALGASEPSSISEKILVSTIKDGVPVKITQQLTDKNVLQSSPNQLTVQFVGSPEPEVKWFRNKCEVFPSAKYGILNRSGTSTLTINEVWPTDDKSEFSCTVSNALGSEKTSCRLHVKKSPVVGRFNPTVSTSEGLGVNFKIPVTGDRPMSVKVVRTGEVEPDDRFNVFDDGTTVSVSLKNVKKDDSGEYKIVFSNDAGQMSVPIDVVVKGPPEAPTGPLSVTNVTKDSCTLQWKPPAHTTDHEAKASHYIVEKRDLTKPDAPWIEVAGYVTDTAVDVSKLMDGHEYEFRVKAVNEEGESEPLRTSGSVKIELPFSAPKAPSQPTATVTGSKSIRLNWTKPTGDNGPNPIQYIVEKKEKDSPVWVRATPAVKQPNTWTSMDIQNLSPDHQYEFRVIAANEAGQSEPSEASEPISVFDPNAVKLPEIVTALKEVTVNEGQDAKFEVELSAIDPRSPPEIIWTKGGNEIHSGPNCQISRNGNVLGLVLRQCQPDFDGETISVKIKNDSGVKRSSAPLNVLTKPKIKLPSNLRNEVQVFGRGEPVSLRVPFTANPAPEVELYIDGKQVDLSKPDSPQFTIEQTSRSVIIRSDKGLNDQDAGLMRIVLSNSVGRDEANIRTAIMKIPEKPSEIVINDVFEDSVVMSWQAPESDPYSPITGYRIEILEPGKSQGWKPIGSSRSPRFIASNLPVGSYSFRVVAESLTGKSEPSDPVENVVISDPRLDKKMPDFGTDASGQALRGRSDEVPSDYDRCYEDIWKTGPPPDTQHKHINSLYDNYDVFEELGSGPFGVIHRGVDKRTKRNYALKFMPTEDAKQQQLIAGDANMFEDVRDPNIQNIHEVYEGSDTSVFVQEFLAGDNLLDKLKKNTDKMTEPEAIDYIRQVASAVKTLHENHIAHLDLKPESFVFDTQNNSKKLKLIDLSLARKMIPDNQIQVSLNSVDFAAPEIVNKEPVGYYTDMWALGAIAYTVLAGEPPFFNANDEVVMDKIRRGEFEFPESKFGEISDHAKDFISSLLKKNKSDRMDIFDALNHPWLQRDTPIQPSRLRPRYDDILNKTRAKYSSHPGPRLGIGRSAFFSPMERLNYRRYKLYDTVFDVSEARPRIIISKHNSYALENDTVDLKVRVIALPAAEVSWFRNGIEIESTGRYLKRKSTATCFTLQISKCQLDDGGEYEVLASNKYGEKRVSVWLHVEAVPVRKPVVTTSRVEIQRHHRRYELDELWQESQSAPFFTYLLRTRLIQSGMPVKLFCTVKGNPVPKITWFKGRTEIGPGDDRYVISYQNGVATLDIGFSELDDAGCYRCFAENAVGSGETSCQVFVQSSSRSRRNASSMHKETIVESERSYRSQTEYRQQYSSTSAAMMTTQYEHRESVSGSSRRSRQIQGSAPVIIEQLSSTTVYEGSVLQLRCSLKARNPVIQWSRNGSDLVESDRIEINFSRETGVASLTIPVVKKFDDAEYSVRVENEFGSAESSALVSVRELIRPDGDNDDVSNEQVDVQITTTGHTETTTDVRMLKHLHGLHLKSGDSMNLECVVQGISDDLNVQWTRNDQIVPDNPDFNRSLDKNGKCVLHVAEVFAEDSGDFGLVVKDADGQVLTRTACTVIITDEQEPEDRVIDFPKSLDCRSGDEILLTTRVNSAKQLSVNYTHNNRIDLVEGEDFTLEKDGTIVSCCLKISAFEPTNAGTYKLTMSSDGVTVFSIVHILNI